MRLLILAGALALGACNSGAIPEQKAKKADTEAEAETVDIPQTVTALAPGTTPMNERVAVLGLLNKRNGLSRELTLKPGQAVRAGDVIVRLRACETAAPWEVQRLTGAFVQVDTSRTVSPIAPPTISKRSVVLAKSTATLAAATGSVDVASAVGPVSKSLIGA